MPLAGLQAFLDERGEDYDDCIEKHELVKRARDCERSTGPPKPKGAAQEEEEEEEEDPLDAFMKDINTEAGKAPDPKKKPQADPAGGMDEEADNIMDFVEARKRGEIKATFMAKGDGSDADVYATQKAMEAGVRADLLISWFSLEFWLCLSINPIFSLGELLISWFSLEFRLFSSNKPIFSRWKPAYVQNFSYRGSTYPCTCPRT
jgi:hypothetical protein